MEDQRQREHNAAVASGQIPKNLLQPPRSTVSKLLGRTAQTNQFRLVALTADFFEPLEAMLARTKTHLLPADKDNKTPSSLDCLALAYLSLALVPDLAFPWLRDAMRSKAPLLAAYTERMRARCLGEDVTPAQAFSPEQPSALPWRAPERISASAVGKTLLGTLADNTPFLSEVRQNRRLKRAVESDESFSSVEKQALSSYADASTKDMFVSIAAVVAGTAALVGYMVHVGLLSVSTRGAEEEESEEDAGVTQFEPASAHDILGI
jgi:sorting and assembly machinery component 37